MAVFPKFPKLLDRVEQPENNINALRLGLALLVIFQHAFDLSFGNMLHEPLRIATHGQTGSGDLSVNLFFFLSGILITASWLRSKSMEDFLRKRIFRIFPGFIVAVLVTIAVTALWSPQFRSEIGGRDWVLKVINDLVTLDRQSFDRPTAFAANPWPGVANGSLWTIQREFLCYLLVALLGMFNLLRWRWLILAAFVLCLTSYVRTFLGGIDVFSLDRRFLTYFLAGICAWVWRDRIPVHPLAGLVVFALLLVANQFPKVFFAILPLAASYVILTLAYAKPVRAFRWCDRWDFSYGVYLYAFLLEQVITSYAWGRHPWLVIAIATPLSLGAAVLSWTLVERPFLKLKNGNFKKQDPVLATRPQIPPADTVLPLARPQVHPSRDNA